MNEIVGHYKPESSKQKLSLTENALAHVQKYIAKRGQGLGLRIGIKKSGCSGYAYVLDYVDAANDDDHVFPVTDAIAIYVDNKSLPLVQGMQIDYIREGLNGRFAFNNPNEASACGCGESFTVES